MAANPASPYDKSEKTVENSADSRSVHSDLAETEIGHVSYHGREDEALKYASTRIVIDQETNKRIRRKIDLHLLPW